MSDRMRPISFEKMVTWIIEEFNTKSSIFGIHKNKFYQSKFQDNREFLGENLGVPIGPAAGPNSQLTQNIIASYLTGSRFIELKTVQIIDGEDLSVAKPCINAEDECYNVEWSTELRVEEAYEEYIKGWFLIHLIMVELSISKDKDFMFNISVGYDLEGIKSKKINEFIENMKDASNTEIWQQCIKVLENSLDKFNKFTLQDLNNISPKICSSITLSTLHGCPPAEIERIATYLLKDKNLHTFIKMNPTLLGEDFVGNTFDVMGYSYIHLNSHHFKNDLQYKDAIIMIKKLKEIAKEKGLELGVKLTNTLPVKILNNELPGEEMYMSGKALYPLTIALASKLSKEFNGELSISYSGGADFFNIDKIFNVGIYPITFATTLLKPGGYERVTQIANKISDMPQNKNGKISTILLEIAAEEAINNPHHVKSDKRGSSRKIDAKLPIYDCAIAPCGVGCPINQQIPEYIALVNEEKYDEAFQVIARDNAAPGITGTICNHNCQTKCTRLHYDSSLEIRNMKKIAVNHAANKYISEIKPCEIKSNSKVCIIGAGAAGLSTALYLRRNAMDVTVFEKREKPYGIINYVIPEFRIAKEVIENDFHMVKAHGVNFNFKAEEKVNLEELQKEFKYIILATGAWESGKVSMKKGNETTLNAIKFLEEFKSGYEDMNLGTSVCVIGGGDVAMDAARAVKRVKGVKNVSVIYRRTKDFMPASSEEIQLTLKDGVNIKELLAPLEFENNKLICEEMILGEKDSSGRRMPIPSGSLISVDATTVIVAVGEKVDSKFFRSLGIEVDSKGIPITDNNCRTSIENVYIGGDAKTGPGTIVNAMAHGKSIAKDILKKEKLNCDLNEDGKLRTITENSKDKDIFYKRKGMLCSSTLSNEDGSRCLGCDSVCELCVDVCPNRANVVIDLGYKSEVIHMDGMCNECGNCGVFCPYKGNPYKDKLTLFWNDEDFINSSNKGFFIKDVSKGICNIRSEDGKIFQSKLNEKNKENESYDRNLLSKEMKDIIKACITEYGYLL
ncbi:MAG: putative selenate reductase subunit YgfK [Clostridium sp.]|uniref:putative selenate reductase subunit YgfK n=1 Tax=Clostridium sp. TaxID=1506 RepID=UPI003051431E